MNGTQTPTRGTPLEQQKNGIAKMEANDREKKKKRVAKISFAQHFRHRTQPLPWQWREKGKECRFAFGTVR